MLPTLLSPASLEACFARDYTGAQVRFRHACDRHEHSVYHEFVYSQNGPDNHKLLTATCRLGAPDAKRLLVLQSATHGVEGFAGSAIQIDCLDLLHQYKLPNGIAVLMIHALNPYGFAWLRRVNETGIDLNRNFIDFTRPLPVNTGYAELADALLPADPQAMAQADAKLAEARHTLGQTAYELAVSGGQYTFADGLFYGGQAASQSRLYLEEIFQQHNLARCEQVAVLDIHTGLGPYGYGELICDHPPGSVGAHWAREVYGPSVTEPALGTSTSVPKLGLVDYYWQEQLGDRVSFVTLEFGTYSVAEMFNVLRRDHILHRSPVDWTAPETQQVKAAIRKFFYPEQPDWQEMILLRGRQVIRQALQGLQELK
ncbi:MAG: M14 family metallopeptidase [Gammaproteobacteria bacterium]|nr:M14 family metallopeptidase [Gammaproteobacteria bacterium]MDH5653873.1 M14 family metallopeptidase [Gammaproteobacteria bacterium]